MGLPQSPSPPHLYPQSLQIKLYQAFIFSIPILFSVILFLLFYLFYLKRRTSSMSPPLSRPSRSSNQAATVNSLAFMGLKGILEHKLPIILFDADSRMKESQCCVCLGEFEVKEELHQLPSCQHVFHKDCIRHWLHSSSTCPLCRCPVVITTKNRQPESPATGPYIVRQENEDFNTNQQVVSADQQAQLGTPQSNAANGIQQQNMIPAEGSSGASTSVCIDNDVRCAPPGSVVITIQTHAT